MESAAAAVSRTRRAARERGGRGIETFGRTRRGGDWRARRRGARDGGDWQDHARQNSRAHGAQQSNLSPIQRRRFVDGTRSRTHHTRPRASGVERMGALCGARTTRGHDFSAGNRARALGKKSAPARHSRQCVGPRRDASLARRAAHTGALAHHHTFARRDARTGRREVRIGKIERGGRERVGQTAAELGTDERRGSRMADAVVRGIRVSRARARHRVGACCASSRVVALARDGGKNYSFRRARHGI